jgi:hypothetical protein
MAGCRATLRRKRLKNLLQHKHRDYIELLGKKYPRIGLSKLAYLKMVYLTDSSGTDEMGWLGSVEVKEDAYYVIKDVFLFKQKVNSGSFLVDPADLAEFYLENSQTPEGIALVNSLCFICHVEPFGDVSFGSPHDRAIMERFRKNRKFFIQAIISKSRDVQFSIYNYEQGLSYRDVAWEIMENGDEELRKQIEKEVSSKVTHVKNINSKVICSKPTGRELTFMAGGD